MSGVLVRLQQDQVTAEVMEGSTYAKTYMVGITSDNGERNYLNENSVQRLAVVNCFSFASTPSPAYQTRNMGRRAQYNATHHAEVITAEGKLSLQAEHNLLVATRMGFGRRYTAAESKNIYSPQYELRKFPTKGKAAITNHKLC